MKKINSFRIIRLYISGFKCFAEKAGFDFGDMTYIIASNGKGKSSIADAIAYAFMGTPFFGGNGLDRLQNANVTALEIRVDFIDDIGEKHTVTRSRKKGVTTITYDGFEIRQADMNAMFGEKDIFLSILNPMYFIDILGESGKKMLEKLLPVVSHEDVLTAISERSRELLKDESLLSPETYIKNRRAEIKELEESLIHYNGQKELLEHQREERASSLAGLQSELEKLRAEIGRTLDCPATIIEAEAKLKALYAEYNSISDTMNYVTADWKCPTCMTVMTKQEADDVKSDLQVRLDILINDGKKAKTALSKLREQSQRFADLENSAREYETKISVLNNLPVEDNYSDLLLETNAEISRLKTLVSEATSYAAVRAELMLAGLKMNRAEIMLTEIIKSTGEVKDCFRFSYDGRDYRCLSLSEKIKAGLEVSELLKRLSGRNYPVFIDNGESICTIDNIKPSGQMIFARVVSGEELAVTHKKRQAYILNSISIIDVAERCGITTGKNTSKTEVRANCPFCNDHKRSMSLNTIKNVFYCHRCEERGNSVTMYSKLMGADTHTVYRELTADNIAA